MSRLNPNTTNCKDFIAITKFGYDLTIDKHTFSKPLHQEKEATQDRFSKGTSNTDFFSIFGTQIMSTMLGA